MSCKISIPDEKVVQKALDGLNGSIDRLHGLIDEERGKLKQDALDVLHDATNQLEELSLQIASLAGLLEAKMAADLAADIDKLTIAANLLTDKLLKGTSDLVLQSTKELQRTAETFGVQLQVAIDSVGLLLEHAERVGTQLVVQVGDAASMLILRLVGGAFALVSLIALVILIVKRSGTGARIGLGVGVLAGLAIVIFAGPLASKFGLHKVVVPDTEAACMTVETDGATLSKQLDTTLASLASKHILPPIDPSPQALVTAVRGGRRTRLAALAGPVARGAIAVTPEAPGDLTALATRVRDAAVLCETYSANPTQKNLAKRMAALALSYLGISVVCQSSAVCKTNELCDLSTGRCLALGIYCERPEHCAAGKECDTGLRRCVPRDQFGCSPTIACRIQESCLNGVCAEDAATLGKPCEVPTAFGPCRAGVWDRSGSTLFCKQVVEKQPETCNNIDDDCNGQVDDVLPPAVGGNCSADAPGRCANGHWVCATGGHLTCEPSKGITEICGNNIDDDCDTHIDNGCAVPNCAGKQCGPDGVGGSCGACTQNESCVDGTCQCGSGETRCGNQCVNLTNDVENCGACGRACLPDPAQCVASQCNTNIPSCHGSTPFWCECAGACVASPARCNAACK